jgi:hypothetical protein
VWLEELRFMHDNLIDLHQQESFPFDLRDGVLWLSTDTHRSDEQDDTWQQQKSHRLREIVNWLEKLEEKLKCRSGESINQIAEKLSGDWRGCHLVSGSVASKIWS